MNAPPLPPDSDNARQLLDFNPQTPIADGLAATWAWYQQQFGV